MKLCCVCEKEGILEMCISGGNHKCISLFQPRTFTVTPQFAAQTLNPKVLLGNRLKNLITKMQVASFSLGCDLPSGQTQRGIGMT
jgi:hypothetical protein